LTLVSPYDLQFANCSFCIPSCEFGSTGEIRNGRMEKVAGWANELIRNIAMGSRRLGGLRIYRDKPERFIERRIDV